MLNTHHITRNYTRRTRTEQRKWRQNRGRTLWNVCTHKYVCQKTITSLVLFNSKCFPITSGPPVLFILKTLVIIVWLWFSCLSFSLSHSLCVAFFSTQNCTRTFQLCAFAELNWIGTKQTQNLRDWKRARGEHKKISWPKPWQPTAWKKWLNSLVILRHSTAQRTVMRHSMAYLCG